MSVPSRVSAVPPSVAPLRRDSESAWSGELGGDSWPGVSYVMPVLNEERDLHEAVTSILEQDYPGQAEVVLALGPSHDGTDLIAEDLALSDPRVRLVRNPASSISVGLNLAIEASSHPVVIRVDAHSSLSAGYTSAAVRTLIDTGAANVGGIMRAQGRTPVQQAIAHGYNSRLGLGGGAYHGHGEAGPAESAYLGVFRRDVLQVGGFDEALARGEDWELNLRIRRAGHLVWFDPNLVVTYWPRASWGDMARQFKATGAWRGELVRRHGAANSLRFFAPPALVAGTGLSAVVGLLDVTRILPRRVRALSRLVHVPVAAYAALVAVQGVRARPQEEFGQSEDPMRVKTLIPPILATMHGCWGFGFLKGLLKGAEGAVDTSRVKSH
ncbi:MAG: glycosyltransferase family 2 protein [Galactobacter sp.]